MFNRVKLLSNILKQYYSSFSYYGFLKGHDHLNIKDLNKIQEKIGLAEESTIAGMKVLARTKIIPK